MNNPFQTLVTKIEDLKINVESNSLDKDRAYALLLEIIDEYANIDDNDVHNWKENLFGFFTLEEIKSHIKDLLHGYLSTDRADNKEDRNQKLFIANEIENLLLILGK